MNYRLRNKNGFTLIELMVAIGILAMIMSFASVIFRFGIDAQRTALANAEIMQKFRAITNQLNADFKGLNKNGEIFIAWAAKPVSAGYKDNDLDGYERFDRIMFFADGDFQSYGSNPMVRGNTARICYMLANKPAQTQGQSPTKAADQKPPQRMLARNQHIMTADPALANFFDPNNFTDSQWYEWNNLYEYDKMSLEQWKQLPFDNKKNMLSVITDIKFDAPTVSQNVWGTNIDPVNHDSIHMLLCDGVGEFKIESWYDAQQRWIPQVDPDRNGNLADTDFILAGGGGALHEEAVPGVLYPGLPYGGVVITNISYPRDQIDSAHFSQIPGLGRALRFTFTLYDSKGILKEGRTFTHIVYLDN